MRKTRILLIIIAVVCFGVALSYPIRYRLAQEDNNANMDELAALRERARQEADDDAENPAEGTPDNEGASGAETDGGETAVTEPSEDAAPAGDIEPAEGEGPASDAGLSEDAESAANADEEDVAPGVPVRPTLAPEASAADGEASDATDATLETGATDAPQATTADAPTEAQAPGEAAAPAAGEASGEPVAPQATGAPDSQAEADETGPAVLDGAGDMGPLENPTLEDLLLDVDIPHHLDIVYQGAQSGPTPAPTPSPSPTPPRDVYDGPLPYPMKEKVTLDTSRILPELREIYALNTDLVGWISIPGTVIDYPVVQTQDSDFYLEHDFYGNNNINGQIILDTLCDPYTPSYNLVISGHHMKNGSMFGDLPEYRTQGYWEKHKLVEFDTLMERKQYVVFAAFYSADYDEDEEGFRYNVNIEYRMDAKFWLEEIEDNRLYDTGIDVEFGDEFITLTTCNRARHRNGRFVVVCRKIREGETFE